MTPVPATVPHRAAGQDRLSIRVRSSDAIRRPDRFRPRPDGWSSGDRTRDAAGRGSGSRGSSGRPYEGSRPYDGSGRPDGDRGQARSADRRSGQTWGDRQGTSRGGYNGQRGSQSGRPGDRGRPDDRRDGHGRSGATRDYRGGEHAQAGADELRLAIPDSITAEQLDPEAQAELRTLPGDLASVIARLLVATSVSEDPDEAYRYAKKARGLAARVGVVRETCAIAAYQAGDWNAALAEFRAARRLTGRNSYLPLMADCERALGRLDRALDIVTGPDARAADPQTRIELRIVESGIRRDQGLLDAAVVALQGPELTGGRIRPEYGRLYYAYADALLEAGREEEARDWFGRAASADVDDETDAAERYEELDDFSFDDLEDEADEDEAEPLADDNDLVADQGLDDDKLEPLADSSDILAQKGIENDDDDDLDNDLLADQGLDDEDDD